MKEIERKFLVEDMSSLNLEKYPKEVITQDYLYEDKFTAIRRRKIEKEETITYIYTVKTHITEGYGTEELEKEISKEEYDSFRLNEKNNQIEKVRYIIPYKDGLKIELDVFKGI